MTSRDCLVLLVAVKIAVIEPAATIQLCWSRTVFMAATDASMDDRIGW